MTDDPRPRLDKANNPGGARWCEDPGHYRLECVHDRNRGRGTCHGPAIRGTDACPLHGGKRRAVALVEGKARVTAWSPVGAPPKGGSPDAGVAVLRMLQMSWLRAAAYGELLRRQVVVDGDQAGDLGEDDRPDTSGLIGFHYGAAGKDGTIYAQSEAVRALVLLESQERDRVVKYAETAHKMGISNRITALAETWGDLVVTRIVVLLDALDLTPDQEARVPALIQAHIGQIDLSAMGGSET